MQADGVGERTGDLDSQGIGKRSAIFELLKLVHPILQIGDPVTPPAVIGCTVVRPRHRTVPVPASFPLVQIYTIGRRWHRPTLRNP